MSGHITAGDIGPIVAIKENTYGVTPSGDLAYYSDLKGDGGSFTPADNMNQYIGWRSRSRSPSPLDMVNQSIDAGYSATEELAADKTKLLELLEYALGSQQGTTDLTPLPSRTTSLTVVGSAAASGSTAYGMVLEYPGCKTDRLVIKADQPGGIVEFQETVMAKDVYLAGTNVHYPTASNLPAFQWVGGVIRNNQITLYPQRFELSINNNLGRVKGVYQHDEEVRSGTVQLVEGKREMEFSMDVWLEDVYYQYGSVWMGENGQETYTFDIGNLFHGIPEEEFITLKLTTERIMDGSEHSLIQDKQMATLRYRVINIEIIDPSTAEQEQA